MVALPFWDDCGKDVIHPSLVLLDRKANQAGRVGPKGLIHWWLSPVPKRGAVDDGGPMLIQDFVQVKAPFATVRDELLERSPGWLADDARAAYADGEQLFLTVSATNRKVPIRMRVHLDLGAPYDRGEGMVVPLTWWAAGGQRLFPTLDADLEVMPLGPDQVMLTLMGRYEPPLGAVGRRMDRLVLHRIAEASVRSFLHRTAVKLERAFVSRTSGANRQSS
jgi:hypothetical protein